MIDHCIVVTRKEEGRKGGFARAPTQQAATTIEGRKERGTSAFCEDLKEEEREYLFISHAAQKRVRCAGVRNEAVVVNGSHRHTAQRHSCFQFAQSSARVPRLPLH